MTASTRREFLAAGTATAAATLAAPAFAQWQPSPRYPDPSIKIVDPSFAKYRVGSAKIERLGTGYRWCEGPVWFGDGRYLLTEKGRAAFPILITALQWAQRWFAAPEGPAVVLRHDSCGRDFDAVLSCDQCAGVLRGADVADRR